MEVQIVITEDSSHTLYVPELDEHYHSVHGAVQESQHVFIEAGLKQMLHRKSLSIFEVGFGTGLNALLTLIEVRGKCQINYTSVEKYPLAKEVTNTLNYSELVSCSETYFEKLHVAPWNIETMVSSGFILNKVDKDLIDFETEQTFDLIYFDAFAPEKQEDMWTEEIFEKIVKLMNPGAVFTTYCAKGRVRRMLQDLGLQVERLKGPPGKREMLRGIKHR